MRGGWLISLQPWAHRVIDWLLCDSSGGTASHCSHAFSSCVGCGALTSPTTSTGESDQNTCCPGIRGTVLHSGSRAQTWLRETEDERVMYGPGSKRPCTAAPGGHASGNTEPQRRGTSAQRSCHLLKLADPVNLGWCLPCVGLCSRS